MQIRTARISASICRAIITAHKASRPRRLLRAILSFFSLFRLFLARYRAADFFALRHDAWHLDEDEYVSSFGASDLESDGRSVGKAGEAELVPAGDLGYSGSTFFTTANSKFLIKSLPRRFEHEFFTHDLLAPYWAHMTNNPHSLLVRIMDMVYTPYATLGGILGTAPTHHIIMENLLYGKDLELEPATAAAMAAAAAAAAAAAEVEAERAEGADHSPPSSSSPPPAMVKWETYDLKPHNYFFPERDIAGGLLAPQSVKDRLTDIFPDRIRIPASARALLLDTLAKDTQLLADNMAVDYSLFLVRFSGPSSFPAAIPHRRPPAIKRTIHPSSPTSSTTTEQDPWRIGVDSINGAWTYRAVVLDFFWAKHKFTAKAMTGLVGALDAVAGTGPMSITAEPEEYRTRFLSMVETLVEVGE